MGKIYKNGIEYGGGGGDSAGHIILDTDGTAMAQEPSLQFKGLNVTDNSTDEVTEVESIGLNQDSMDDVLNASIPGNQVASNGLVYSTEEQVVGRWVDGKPIYQKTIQGTTTNYKGGSASVNIGLVIDNIVLLDGYIVINDINSGDLGGFVKIGGDVTACGISYDKQKVTVYQNWEPAVNKSFYITLQYTKTTD